MEETPPPNGHLESFPDGKQSRDHKALFVDLEGCNVGFSNWHPVSVAHMGDRLCGQSTLGGAWEWTATPLADFDGFQPMEAYPGYTADFFDGKHNVMLGGSWATHPRIAGRKTLYVSFFVQHAPLGLTDGWQCQLVSAELSVCLGDSTTGP